MRVPCEALEPLPGLAENRPRRSRHEDLSRIDLHRPRPARARRVPVRRRRGPRRQLGRESNGPPGRSVRRPLTSRGRCRTCCGLGSGPRNARFRRLSDHRRAYRSGRRTDDAPTQALAGRPRPTGHRPRHLTCAFGLPRQCGGAGNVLHQRSGIRRTPVRSESEPARAGRRRDRLRAGRSRGDCERSHGRCGLRDRREIVKKPESVPDHGKASPQRRGVLRLDRASALVGTHRKAVDPSDRVT